MRAEASPRQRYFGKLLGKFRQPTASLGHPPRPRVFAHTVRTSKVSACLDFSWKLAKRSFRRYYRFMSFRPQPVPFRPRVAVLSVVLVAAFVALSCTYLKETIGLGPVRPKVQITDIAVKRVTMTAIDLIVTVRVQNPNSFDLSLSKLRYKMTAGDLDVAQGTFMETITVPEKGESLVSLPLAIDASNVVKIMKDVLTAPGDKDIQAVTTAVADFATPIGDMEVDFSDKRSLRKLAGL